MKNPQSKNSKNIQTILKTHFPETCFSVADLSFTGGDVIAIAWEDGVTDKQVETVVTPYQDVSLPSGLETRSQVPYVLTLRSISKEIWDQAFTDAKNYFVFLKNKLSLRDSLTELGYPNVHHFIFKHLRKIDLTHGYSFESLKNII